MNYYAQAIDIITRNETDFRALVIAIAKHHPKVIVDAVARQTLSPVEEEVLPMLRHGRKVQAIKLWREQTGQGLKESKQAVEDLMLRMGV